MPLRERVDRLERLTNLVLVLLETTHPLTLLEISGTVAGYPTGTEAARQAFERDKRALRELGIPLRMEPVESEQQVGYRIHPDDYYLPELALDSAEEQALGFAIAAVQLGGAAGSDAIAKLGNPLRRLSAGQSEAGGAGPGLAPVAVLPSLPALGPIHEALRQRALVRFRYHGRERQVEPSGLAFRAGAWYLVGRDRAAEGGPARRTFRVDRLESFPSVGEPGAFDAPAAGDLRDEIRLLPWSSEEAASEVPLADVVVDARQAGVVATQVPRAAISSFEPDGSLRLRLRVGDAEAFVSWVVGLGDTAVVLRPEGLRAAVLERLAAVAGGAEGAAPDPGEGARPRRGGAGSGRSRPARGDGGKPRPAAGGSARLANAVMAGERLRRLLAILAHLAQVGEAELAEVADRFSIGEDELVHELELAACCGVPPYSPDELIELYVDGDRVVANRLREFERPQRLTPDEGFVLAAATRALLAVPGADEEGVLRSALDKLEDALGAARLAVDIEQPAHLGALQQAARDRERVEIEYFSSSATSPRRRQVDPYQVVLREGSWYLDGWCHLAGGLRRFQVDRVRSVEPVGEHFEEPLDLADELQRPGAFLGGADAVAARIAFPAGSELAVEQVAVGPIEALADGSGRLSATVLVGDAEGWFGRLLLRLGPGAEVLTPEGLKGVAVHAAERALRRYEDEPVPPAGWPDPGERRTASRGQR